MRMSREDEIETAIVQCIRHCRIMHQQHLPARAWRGESMDASQGHAHELEIVLRKNNRAINQPGAASGRERALKIRKRNVAPVIVISRRTVNGRSNLLNETKRFRGKPSVFDEIARETDKLGRKLIDRAHPFGRIAHVALMMEVSEMDETAGSRTSAQIEFRDPQRCRFDEPRSGPKRRG